jgi:branched-chain amino acid transport system substrate-binding protein
MKIVAQAMAETKSTDSTKLVEHFEKEAKFPLMKTRDGYFRKSDHQMMHEMYTVRAIPGGAVEERVGHLHLEPAGAGAERAAGGHRDAGATRSSARWVTRCC